MCTTPKSAAGLQNQDLAPLFIVRPTLLWHLKKKKKRGPFFNLLLNHFIVHTYDQAQAFLSPPARPKALKALTLTTH